MKNLAIVGVGTNAQNYYAGIEDSTFFTLVAVCDKNTEVIAKGRYSHVAAYTDFDEMCDSEKIDYLVICTPPVTHFDIAMNALKRGINVIIEKPATMSLNELEELQTTAAKLGRTVTVIFHWAYGSDAIFLKDYLPSSVKPKEIIVSICDPYCTNDGRRILDSKIGLEGCWLDSGINAISFIEKTVGINSIISLNKEFIIDKSCELPYYSKHRFLLNGSICLTIIVDWRQGINRKFSKFVFDDMTVDVYHTDMKICKDDEEIFRFDSRPRLVDHYYNFFTHFTEGGDDETARKLHKILFANNYEKRR